jgi:hypothetical protein
LHFLPFALLGLNDQRNDEDQGENEHGRAGGERGPDAVREQFPCIKSAAASGAVRPALVSPW